MYLIGWLTHPPPNETPEKKGTQKKERNLKRI